MATAAPGGMNPAYLLDPSLYGGQQQVDQQQALANLLIQQGLAPQGGTEMAGQVAIRNSPMQGIAKIAALLSGQNIQQTANQGQQALAQRQAGMMAQMFGMGGQPQGVPGQQDPQGGAPAAGPSAPQQPQGGSSGPMSVTGASPMTNFMDYATDPAAHMKAVMDQFAQTPEMKMAAAAYGINSPAYQQVLRQQVIKAGYIPPNEIKAGNLTTEAVTNKPIAYNPGMDKGIAPTWATDANGFTTATQGTAIPGYADAAAGIKGSESAATTANTIQSGTDSQGHPITGYGSDVYGTKGASPIYVPPSVQQPRDKSAIPLVQAEIANLQARVQANPNDRQAASDLATQQAQLRVLQAGGSPVPNLGGAPKPSVTRVMTGPSPTDTVLAKTGADVIAQAPAIVQGSKSAIVGLQNALGQVEAGTPTGQGTAKTINVLALLNNMGVPLGKGDVDGYQTLQKYLQNSLNQAAAGTGATGSDARFESFMHGQPNADTMNPTALKGAIRYVLSQHDAAVARGTFIPQAAAAAAAQGDPSPGQTAQQQWSQLYNPHYFEVQRLAPAEQVKAVQAMSPADAQHFIAWRKALGQTQ